MATLSWGVVLAGAWCAVALALQLARARAFGPRRLFAPAAGDPMAGARHAFTGAMLPRAKESVMMHLPSYLAGITYHVGIFASFGLLLARITGWHLPGVVRLVLGTVCLVGALAGAALLLKRALDPHLRGLSNPDDFISNALATIFAALAGATVLAPGVEPAWILAAIVLLAYIPLGKIKHCVFFFPSRYHLGAFFGRRGTFPPSS